MKFKLLSKIISIVLVFAFITSCINTILYANETESSIKLPEPIKAVDFSYDFEELSAQDSAFEVVDNKVSPELISDTEMGQVLLLKEAIIKNKKESTYIDKYYDESEYSTIMLTNPYKGLDYLKEYEPYEDVEVTEYELGKSDPIIQPLWKEGITISYWIKTPSARNGLGLNSNVLGFTSERFQMQADDYAYYLCTVKFDLDYNKWTSEEKEILGITSCGVDQDSDFYFELADEKEYNGKPLYIDVDKMGRMYWMNKYYVQGYTKDDNGEITEIKYNLPLYDKYSSIPDLGDTKENHNPNDSVIRYGWTYGEMWLDASSSFYFNNDCMRTKQLNPNHENSFNNYIELQPGNMFNINSWKGSSEIEYALENGEIGPSPVSSPDKWHNVTVVIQNDWVKYYMDGEEIDILENYSSFGQNAIANTLASYLPWKRFNKGTGSRYGFGCNKSKVFWCLYGNYCSPTIMEWITMDSVKMSIGGSNLSGYQNCMNATTDEIMLKNIVFYDKILDSDQIKLLSSDPFIYDKRNSINQGDVNGDGKINAEDALAVLKYSAKIDTLNEEQIFRADMDCNNKINASDALAILTISARIE